MKTGLPVLVGTDLSDASFAAIRQGAAWAARYAAPLSVAHVVPHGFLHDGPGSAKEAEILSAIRKLLEPLGAGAAEVVLTEGAAHRSLLELATARACGLVVVGASGGGSLKQVLFGSTAASVARYAGCSVLVARPSPEHGPVLVGTDFSDAVTPALEVGGREALARSARLVLLHSNYEPRSPLHLLGPIVISAPEPAAEDLKARDQAALTTLNSLLAAHAGSGDCLVVNEAPDSALVDQAELLGASLVVVGTHGRTGFARMALGSVAEAVAGQATCSVLIARRHE